MTPSFTNRCGRLALGFSSRARSLVLVILAGSSFVTVPSAHAQGNYEIQVYGSALVPAHQTMVELHSNFTARGSTLASNGTFATNHAIHETVEVTHGFSEWFEVGFYLFVSERGPEGVQYVGNHIRPRFSIPERFHWPVGLSLSQEIGYQRKEFSEDTWSWEMRPIIDEKIGRAYWSFNPTLDKSLRGPNAAGGFVFAPNAQVNFDVTKRVNVALEYYGAFGPLGHFDPYAKTSQQIFPAVNLDFGDDWEVNAGVGFGLTTPTDHLLAKLILGRRVGGKRAPRDRP